MIEWIMMGAFILALGLSFWKLYAFLPNTPLEDDDTTEEAVNELMELMLRAIVETFEHHEELDTKILYEHMTAHELFDRERFWRFNRNRLNNLIIRYFALHPHASSFEHIYEAEKARFTRCS